MTEGSLVKILHATPAGIESEEVKKYRPVQGVVSYISPNGWILVRVRSRVTGEEIYREEFWPEDLEAL